MSKKSYTKKEYETLFNEVLGIDVSWSKLPKEDLTQIAVLLANPEILIKKLTDKGDGISIPSMIGGLVISASEKFDGPIMKALRKMAGT